MFDLSWIELLFCGALALVVIGPRDLPPLFRAAGRLATRCRRLYNSTLGSVRQLENEIAAASGKAGDDKGWEALLPEEVRNLPADFRPGSFSPEQHRARANQIQAARDTWQRQRDVDEANERTAGEAP